MYKLSIKRTKSRQAEKAMCGEVLDGPVALARVAHHLLRDEDQEVVLLFLLDSQFRVIGYTEVARGGLSACTVDPRILWRTAFLTPQCTSVVLAHNHPSDNVTPSPEDDKLTDKVQAEAKLLGFAFLDHVIVGGVAERNYSYAANGHIKDVAIVL